MLLKLNDKYYALLLENKYLKILIKDIIEAKVTKYLNLTFHFVFEQKLWRFSIMYSELSLHLDSKVRRYYFYHSTALSID
jgi:hypothetical protein